ncbi:MAG: type II toxin-antitoxin system PemK/MazF family toxin [Candidatus Moraniibacteriota bacterium]|nr:MAG: type II toxin-antitoxin system PemK/MazF family toxin [Candidatus Moranbacteria bacterium]
MRRGDLVTVAVQGDYGKPRPALVIQSDVFGAMRSRTVLLLTSDPEDTPLLRVRVEPMPANGLRVPSWVMIDKAMSLRTDRIGPSFGHLDDATMVSVSRSLALFLGIAG